MIKKLSIRNFGLHKKLIVKFGARITCLVGKSYAGKSTILRALRWNMLNKPAGTKLIRWGAKKAKVILRLKNLKITRERSTNNNKYNLSIIDSDSSENYYAFGNSVPDRIAEHFNVGEDNFQRQQDAPFWFGLSSSAVNKELNRIISLNKIDNSISNLNSEQNKNNSLIRVLSDRIEQLRQTKKTLKPILKLKPFATELENLSLKIQQQQKETDRISNLISSIENFQSHMKEPPSIDELEESVANLSYAEKEIEDLEYHIHVIEQQQKDITYLEKQINHFEELWKKKVGDRCPLCLRKRKPPENQKS